MNDYKYDVFVSYRRKDPVLTWLDRWFLRELGPWLAEAMPRQPQVFVDRREIAPGTMWPDELATALASSRCLLAIWSPQYFRSDWCVAEWRSFVERERLASGASPLVLPVAFHDGEHFAPEAQSTQSRDFRSHSALTRRTTSFIRDVQEVAGSLAKLVAAAPPWQAWPVVRPTAPTLKNPPLSRIG